jgi:G6PDH family F420-dependent oxidoreductase
MTSFGYTLSAEEHEPAALVEHARLAEEHGFDFCSISDHYHPWVSSQGHSPFVWTVLGAIAQATERVDVGVGVSCPIVRVHPVIAAQAAATTSLLFDGRFFLGVGTGEALNEHVTGDRWPRPEIRRAMLEEAVGIMRALWTGDTVDRVGTYYEVDNARLFDAPHEKIPVIVSGFGPEATELAGRIGDGYWGHAPERETIERFERAGGSGSRYAQLNLCWARDLDDARETAYRTWPNAAVPGQLSQDLPTWTHFEQASRLATVDDVVESIPVGPDITQEIQESVASYVDAGYDHLYFHQIGADQHGFFAFWEQSLRPALREAVA